MQCYIKWRSLLGKVFTSELNWSFYCMPSAAQPGYGRLLYIQLVIGQANYAATKAGVVGLTKRQRKWKFRYSNAFEGIQI